MCIKVYISGKVSGLSEAEYTDKFAKAEAILQFKGFETINPVQVVNDAQASWEDAMKLCINALLSCNAVFALPCALESRGARIEIELATELGIPVFESLNHLSLHYLQAMKTIPYYRECVAFFMQHYSEYTGVKYMFEAKDGKALKSILAKIVAIKESHDDTLLLFQQIILELPEWDKRNAFSLTSINSRFNVIVAAIKQQKKVSHGFKEQIINELFKQ